MHAPAWHASLCVHALPSVHDVRSNGIPLSMNAVTFVVLNAAGEKRLGVIKAIREITGLGLKESKDMVEATPSKIKTGLAADEAKALKEKLEAEGATVEVKASPI